jgi:hypothetical protein
MLAADQPGLVDGLLLLSYPLHPPQRPGELRTAHFPRLQTPALFVSGNRDGFVSIDELGSALTLIPARTELLSVTGAGHAKRRDRLDVHHSLCKMRLEANRNCYVNFPSVTSGCPSEIAVVRCGDRSWSVPIRRVVDQMAKRS